MIPVASGLHELENKKGDFPEMVQEICRENKLKTQYAYSHWAYLGLIRPPCVPWGLRKSQRMAFLICSNLEEVDFYVMTKVRRGF